MSQTIEAAVARCVTLRRAVPGDFDAVTRLLSEQSLPPDGVAEWLPRFWIAEHDGTLVGVAGMELYGEAALLRSVAVSAAWRGSGLGRLLTERVLADASASASEVFLLTTTAERYFPRLGFACVSRDSAPAALAASAELRGACPASAVLMRRPVTPAAASSTSTAEGVGA